MEWKKTRIQPGGDIYEYLGVFTLVYRPDIVSYHNKTLGYFLVIRRSDTIDMCVVFMPRRVCAMDVATYEEQ